MAGSGGGLYSIPPDAPLTDVPTLMEQLIAGAAYARNSADLGGIARLLEAAAQALQQQQAESKVQRGLAIASQTLAAELSLKCEGLQSRLAAEPQHGDSRPPPAIAPPAWPYGEVQTPAAFADRAGGGTPHAANAYSRSLPTERRPSSGPPTRMTPADEPDGYADDARRLGPRAFKTWVQEAPQPWLGSAAAHGYERASPSVPSLGAEQESAERAVDGMVDSLKARFEQSGVSLPLEKHAGCVYRLGQRKLSLNIRNNRLMVRVGGGFCDFLEYLSKASL